MLNRLKTRPIEWVNAPLLSTLTRSNMPSDGQPMIIVRENNEGVYRPSNGTANTVFGGFSMFEERVLPSVASKVEEVTADGTTITLSRAINSLTDILVKNLTAGANATYTDGAGSTGQWDGDVGSATLTINAAQSGNDFRIIYKYDLTVNEAAALYGHGIPGPSAIDVLSACQVITRGDVYTDYYSAAVDWTAMDTDASGEILKGIANGVVGVNANGAQILKASLIHVPSVDDPFLGIRLL